MSAGGAEPARAGEFGRIARFFAPLAEGFGGARGLVDDAALYQPPPGRALVLTHDTIVADVHFLGSDPPEDIAAKLLGANLSDLAAKGADPALYLLSVSLPASIDDEWVARFASGLAEVQARFGLQLAGGDSTSTAGPVTLGLTAIGTVDAHAGMPARSGARPGDALWVTGTIGDAACGLALATGQASLDDPQAVQFLIERYRRPEPRCGIVQALRAHISACLDVSDGLVADSGHIAAASDVGIEIMAEAVPLSGPARAMLDAGMITLAGLATGGDDYELVFTGPDDLPARTGDVACTRIGRVIEGRGVRLLGRDGTSLMLERTGWQHG